MTKKDYELLAKVIKQAANVKPTAGEDFQQIHTEAVEVVARKIAYALQDRNAAFDRGRFLSACGFE